MSDFESSLKKAWEACPCRRVFADSMQADECEGRHCSCSRAGQKDESYVSKCRWSGHAALLEMVDEYADLYGRYHAKAQSNDAWGKLAETKNAAAFALRLELIMSDDVASLLGMLLRFCPACSGLYKDGRCATNPPHAFHRIVDRLRAAVGVDDAHT